MLSHRSFVRHLAGRVVFHVRIPFGLTPLKRADTGGSTPMLGHYAYNRVLQSAPARVVTSLPPSLTDITPHRITWQLKAPDQSHNVPSCSCISAVAVASN